MNPARGWSRDVRTDDHFLDGIRGRDRLEVLRPNIVLMLCRGPFSGHARVDDDASVEALEALAVAEAHGVVAGHRDRRLRRARSALRAQGRQRGAIGSRRGRGGCGEEREHARLRHRGDFFQLPNAPKFQRGSRFFRGGV
eukprot:scaffold95447_cov74-Phaeocystis_antarctica.AAC.1